VPRTGNPDRKVAAIYFQDESGVGLMLQGNHLSLLPRPRLAATQSPDGPIPTLRRLGAHTVEIFRHDYRVLDETNLVLHLWRLTNLDDGEYQLESTMRLRKRHSLIWESRFGQIYFAVENGVLHHLNLDPAYRPVPGDLSRRMQAMRAGAAIDEERA
jgi:hypothetical protein